jgi:hypothetical protein
LWINRVWYVRPRRDLQTVGHPSYGHAIRTRMVYLVDCGFNLSTL